MTYAASEQSVQLARPIEIYTIDTPLASYRLTSHNENVTVGGLTFVATVISRGHAKTMPLGESREMIVSLPVSHAICQLLIGNGIPPRDCIVTISRTHIGLTETRQVWTGKVSTISTDGSIAQIRIPSLIDDAFNVPLPGVKAQRTCNHLLYSTGCGVNRGLFFGALTVVSVSADGKTIEVDMMGAVEDQWARLGEIQRVDDGERRTILDQTGTTLTIDVPIPLLAADDRVFVFAGCDRQIATCRDKFNNVINFGGHPHMPDENPHAPSSWKIGSIG